MDAYSTNDFLEVRWASKKLQEVLNTLPKITSSHLYQNFCQEYDLLGNFNIPFITCLTEEKDMLSQWRGYANDGHGFAIGFDTKEFSIDNHLPSTRVLFDKGSIGLCRVVYDDNNQIEMTKKLLGESLENETDLFYKVSALSSLKYIFKNSAFKYENEWRIIHTPMISKDLKSGKHDFNGNISELKFRTKNNDLVPYFIFPFHDKPNPIKEILVGPKNTISAYKIEAFLSTNGFNNIPIYNSKASYR